MNDQNTGYFFTVGFKPYRVSLLLLKINSNWDWTKFGKKKLRSAYLVNYLLMRKIPLPRNFVLDSDFADGRKNTSKLFEENKNSCKYYPCQTSVSPAPKKFWELFIFFRVSQSDRKSVTFHNLRTYGSFSHLRRFSTTKYSQPSDGRI